MWLVLGMAAMFFTAMQIVIDFGVGLFDLHGTLPRGGRNSEAIRGIRLREARS